MPPWDELRSKFQKDSSAARIDKEHEVNQQRLIEGGAPTLYASLREQASAAVNSINADNKFLLFADSDLGETPGFRILYNRADGQREAKVQFHHQSNSVTVAITGHGTASGQREYKIAANQEKSLAFMSGGGLYSVDSLIASILSQLL